MHFGFFQVVISHLQHSSAVQLHPHYILVVVVSAAAEVLCSTRKQFTVLNFALQNIIF